MQEKQNRKVKSICLGPSSLLHAYEDKLLHYIFELQEQGILREGGSFAVLFCLLMIKHHGLVHWIGKHISQQDPSDLEDIAVEFMVMVRDYT